MSPDKQPPKRHQVLFLNRMSDISLQVQLAARLKELIRSGQLGAGDPLASTRELAAELKVSRNTVVYAYERLISEGYLSSRLRSRVYVSDTAPELRSAAQRSEMQRQVHPDVQVPKTSYSLGPKPFRPCQPDVQLFPLNSMESASRPGTSQHQPEPAALQLRGRTWLPPSARESSRIPSR